MGAGIAANLIRGGYEVVIFSRRSLPDSLIAAGAVAAGSLADLANTTATIITVLPDDEVVREVVAGPEGLLSRVPPGAVIIDMSTISPLTARDLSRVAGTRDAMFVDAPVSGGQRGAEEGTLSIMVGAEPHVFERIRPVLDAVGSKVTRIGGPGAGQVAKAANQIVVGLTIQAVAEALALAELSGEVDIERVREALLGGFAQSRVLEEHGDRMITGRFEPGARMTLHLKDLRIARELASTVGADVPATDALCSVMEDLVAQGHGDLDQSAVSLAYGKLTAGTPGGVDV
jgi:2-hydroxy-3-oxopropionate reductase